ncbi:MAG: metallophosphoesterase, partial [Clostridia bacterium]|nr:metallophosphoesterase [Clostridia bacterium]
MERKSKIRILHTGDVHLDSPFSRLGSEKGAIRRRELRGVFTSMMLYAKTQKADIVLISGDLFDVGFAGEETVSLIIKEFAKAPECKFVISAGNHDPYTELSVWAQCKWPDHVHIFKKEYECIVLEELGCRVHGGAFFA